MYGTEEGKDDVVVVDMIGHAFDHRPENEKNEVAREVNDIVFDLNKNMQPEGYQMSEDLYYRDHSGAELERVMFYESDVDHMVYGTQALDDYFHDGWTKFSKGVEINSRVPHRTSPYASVNPLADDVLQEIEFLHDEFNIEGLKLYPVRYNDGQALAAKLNDPEVGIPIIEKCQELGIERIAVHKAVPLGRSAQEHYATGDVADAAAMFPDVDFEIVHAGWAFLEDTKYLLGRYPNIWANLEITMSLIINQPRRFARMLGELLLWSGPDKIMFATGCTFVHPQPLIEKFWEFEMPEDLKEEEGYPEVTEEVKRKILGENAIRFLDLDKEEMIEKAQNDRWARKKAEDGRAEPWSSIGMSAMDIAAD
jgi:predicted TIM-barrel fold metal-dependent hydrolase